MDEAQKMDDISVEKDDERLQIKFTTQSKRLICIEYPGYIKNISKALQTFGGEKQLDTVLKDPLRRVGLHFRPNDPYCRQGFGDRFPVTDLLMKVKRKKRKANGMSGEGDIQYECEILGVIDTVVKFKGLADYQYLAPKIPDLLDGLRGSEMLDIETPLHIPPPAFCRVDHPFDYQYRPDPVQKDEGLQANEQHLGVTSRKPRPSHVTSCNFHIPDVPSQPKEGALKEVGHKKEGLDVIQRLFNIRPIWSRRAIKYHLGEKANHRVKTLLACVAYYWIGGPWRTFWTKFGYDPRKNPAAKIYQKLDFRLRSKKALRGIQLPPTLRSVYEHPLTTRYQKIVSNPVVPLGVTNTNTSEKAGTNSEKPSTSSENSTTKDGNWSEMAETQELLPYAFYPDHPPVTRQIIYQLCDIRCAKVQKLISANDGRESVCSETDGWLEPGTIEKIREILTDNLIALHKKQKAATDEETAGPIFARDELSAEIEEEEASFLDTLMDDDDVEAYEILDEDF